MADLATRDDIVRLFGRAAFGASKADLDAWVGKPYADAVSSLVDVPDPATRLPDVHDVQAVAMEQGFKYGESGGYNDTYVRTIQMWWLERMRSSPHRLEERMTLLLHDHFATSVTGAWPDPAQMVTQNQLLRRHSLGSFRELLLAMTLDQAMLWWLNGNLNFTPKPNENYARELMELFALGLTPQVYTETDVREAARALTGWTIDLARQVVFNPSLHDAGTKTLLGRTITDAGAEEHKVVVETVLDQPVAARFVAWKLVIGLAYHVAPGDLLTAPDSLVRKVADRLVATDWDLREAVRTLLLSPEFRVGPVSEHRQLVRSPIEVAVQSLRLLGLQPDPYTTVDALRRMGQLPFQPPNVSGWPVGGAWLGPATVIARYDWAAYVFDQWGVRSQTTMPLPVPEEVGAWVDALGLPALSPSTRAAVDQVLADQAAAPVAERQKSMLLVLLSSPEWTVV